MLHQLLFCPCRHVRQSIHEICPVKDQNGVWEEAFVQPGVIPTKTRQEYFSQVQQISHCSPLHATGTTCTVHNALCEPGGWCRCAHFFPYPAIHYTPRACTTTAKSCLLLYHTRMIYPTYPSYSLTSTLKFKAHQHASICNTLTSSHPSSPNKQQTNK